MVNNCIKCNIEGIHAKGLCYKCYKHQWKPRKVICKRCQNERYYHSKGYCASCFNFLFHIDKIKAYNCRKEHNLDINTYKIITKECILCRFNKIVDLHHLDENKKNNHKQNLIGLCPNHHKMFHNYKYKKEIIKAIKNKGYKVPKDCKLP